MILQSIHEIPSNIAYPIFIVRITNTTLNDTKRCLVLKIRLMYTGRFANYATLSIGTYRNTKATDLTYQKLWNDSRK